MEILKKLIIKHKQIVLYIFFGGITTLINIVSYYIFFNHFGYSNLVSNTIAWLLAVIVAFITNKIWVFNSKSFNPKIVMRELLQFTAVRIATGFVDTAIMYIGVDLLKSNGVLMKVISNVIVLVSNYIGSRFLIFKEK